MTKPLQDPGVLRAMGETPDDVRAGLVRELDALEAHLRTRQADWTRVQPGREWSPAQELEHVMKIGDSIVPLFRLLTSDRELRPTAQTPGVLKDGRRQAPAPSLPSENGVAWADWEARWAAHRDALVAGAAGVRETPGRTYWHPFYGELDALDWLRMVSGHIRGHRELLERSATAEPTPS
ncbi:DinB family protein [Deinococcus ficus]|uniref:DinB family protein n=1 Tax=Deinococcus ficus TaxID=317577 RepID=UPI0003B6FAF8|nr:DinB family protein [Deinococcus ficus]